METFRSMLSGQKRDSKSRTSYSIYKNQDRGSMRTMVESGDDSACVEMKMVEPDMDDDPETSLTSDITNLVLRKPRDYKRAIVYLILTALLIFITAFLLGYIAFRESCTSCSNDEDQFSSALLDDYPSSESFIGPGMLYWTDLREMLQKYLRQESIENTVWKYSQMTHPPGSSTGSMLAAHVLETFKKLKLDHTWTDSHYATLQFPDRMKPNYLQIVDNTGMLIQNIPPTNPEAYCAYSATGNVTGGLVYSNYGQKEDFERLLKLGVEIKGNIAIMRIGKISFAEKVANAERFGAAGALIYPDPIDIPQDPRGMGLHSSTAISEHVHLGSGDPFTPGFPSFNHTQFPPVQSSGLPSILAQTISANAAFTLLSQLSGPSAPKEWNGRLSNVPYSLGPNFTNPERLLRLGVNNYFSSLLINNIFGCIEGKHEPDQYIIIGAQRDAWGPGAAKSGVGTAILLQLARSFSSMVQNGFQPRRSLLFVSWDAGDFGNVGATEWLEGYLTMLHLKAVAYFSLDKAVLGDDRLYAYTSPLLANLIEGVIKQVDSPRHAGQTIHMQLQNQGLNWKSEIIRPLFLNSGAYSFTAFGGVPAMEISFKEDFRQYPFLNTEYDTFDNLQLLLEGRLALVGRTAAELVGLMVMKLAHDHILPLDYSCYSETTLQFSTQLNKYSRELQAQGLTLQWIFSARGDYSRAADQLRNAILNSNEHDHNLARMYNVRIMRVEFYFLSQYVSSTESPFRHILHGRGNHTLSALREHLALLRTNPSQFDENQFRRQLALLTWTLQGAANALSGEVWNIDNMF
ncbi:transferrin receptor protein 2 isoform X1 [Erpetoichthys calabaricus]|uniref:transferrin receptor protein 2 isoform X1 n=1 Tax=Erpetoichthys calabaricus TaxID=27687 RepID=UPI00109F9224|nr:transferrin receptor protein 2 isoform X1 [Erpetoichthys calabaricus]